MDHPHEAWCDVPVEGGQTMIYGPRFGRLYLLAHEDALSPQFLRAIGLAGVPRVEPLNDPAESVLSDRTTATEPAQDVAPLLSNAYRAFDASRRLLPMRQAVRVVRWWAGRPRGGSRFEADGVEAMGRVLHAVESRASNPNCYPRALVTALLSVAAGRSCSIVIGVLSPTRMMHAWCVVDGVVPYERDPEHFLYQPLWTRTLSA
jgi:hypothetical protein